MTSRLSIRSSNASLQNTTALPVWRERATELSSQGALGFTPWIDVERKLGGVISVRSSFSQIMPDYLELKNEIRRIIDTR